MTAEVEVAVVTTVSGRREHLANQRRGLEAGIRPPDLHVVVAMGDPGVRVLLGDERACHVIDVPVASLLPLAAARNAGAMAALRAGARTLVFLDVDCIPSATLVARYASLAADPRHATSILCGQVSYLPPAPSGDYDLDRLRDLAPPHPGRPALADDDVRRTDAYHLFWSLSFAMSAQAWATVGGFCEDYAGYGGEDTDFGQSAKAVGVDMCWVGGAAAYHQHHPVSDPPFEHLVEILENARVFAARWGWWPMAGWLSAFEEAGLIELDETGTSWVRRR